MSAKTISETVAVRKFNTKCPYTGKAIGLDCLHCDWVKELDLVNQICKCKITPDL